MPKGDNDKAWERMYPREPAKSLTDEDLRGFMRRLFDSVHALRQNDAEYCKAREAAEQARLAWWC